ncbi:MAG: Trk system potassium transporter TrkA [Planctomycetota bacterium]|nr:MAG: Trk system potassium transporter TrkA [Planctomycetota bacterium]REJ94162.1 MAG: Trk system potassium transporter TrkA [Planctomycetota bacterium]REK26348.1 MAG: Trk system potassium transporter TrkA [Planctomycetota bacterium]REK45899.1 MAG: Trk system potassium transporter TrkA [Planctomycetota bacterium]
MNIVVLGCGTVGTSIADVLCQHRHNVTVIDQDSDKTQKVNERLDVRTLTGNASQSSVLFQAGVPSCDLCLAVTGSDEVNLIAASMAKAMGAGRTIARVYAPVYRDLSTFDYHRHFHVDRLLSLEHLSAMELAHGIRHGGTVAMESFARGKLEVDEFEISPNAAAVDKLIKELGLPTGIRIACVSREGQTTLALADEQLRVGDRVTLIGTAEAIEELKGMFQTGTTPRRDVVIAGGGETGYHLALALQHGRFGVVLMERDIERCEYLAAKLERTTVVNSDATYRDQLEEERVGTADVFVATTGDDEENIMACVTAREIGAKQILSIVSRPDYAEVVGKLGIDQAVSPREVVARQVLGLLHKGAVISRSSLGAGGLNVFEIEVREGAPITEHVLANVRLPAKCLIAVVVQEDFVRVPGADDRLHAGDTVIALIDDSAVAESLQMFSTNGS